MDNGYKKLQPTLGIQVVHHTLRIRSSKPTIDSRAVANLEQGDYSTYQAVIAPSTTAWNVDWPGQYPDAVCAWLYTVPHSKLDNEATNLPNKE